MKDDAFFLETHFSKILLLDHNMDSPTIPELVKVAILSHTIDHLPIYRAALGSIQDKSPTIADRKWRRLVGRLGRPTPPPHDTIP